MRFAGNPSCANSANGVDVICAVRGTDNRLYGIRFDSSQSSIANQLLDKNGVIVDDPSCAPSEGAAVYQGGVVCAVKGTDNSLWGIQFDMRGLNTNLHFLGGTIVGDPSCASANNATPQVICAVKGWDNSLWGVWFDPRTSGFSNKWQYLAGIIDGDPSCASPNDYTSQVICAGKGDQNGLFSIRFSPVTGFNSGYNYFDGPLGGPVIDNPSCADTLKNRVVCGVKGRDLSLYGIAVY
jgi:hypothetical protein